VLRRFYNNVLALAASPRAGWWLAAIAFAEASCFPIPPDTLLIPMIIARPRQAWVLAGICTVASVCGGALGYLIGYALFDQLAQPLLRFYHYDAGFQRFQAMYRQYGFWVILIKGLTPIPYKIVTIASGAAKFNFAAFMTASLITRGARFFLLAAILRRFGEPVRYFIERRLTLVTSLAAAAVVGGFMALRWL
jgi:membrane protein YqaA with SNARE-associated domain